MKLNLTTAQHYAEKLQAWLAPYVHRIQLAGSARRQRPLCNDIDLVCIPKLRLPANDLLGQPTGEPESLLREFLIQYTRSGKAWFRSEDPKIPGPEPKADAVLFYLQLPKCELDVFAANEETFITRLITRTGSREHNIWIAERAKRMGGQFLPQSGLMLGGETIRPQTEADFYAALDLPFIEPRDREACFLRTLK